MTCAATPAYTLHDFDRLAKTAVHSAGLLASDWHDRYDTAWSAIVERAYDTPPADERTLIFLGRSAIFEEVRGAQHHYGYLRGQSEHGAFSSTAFWRYWWDQYFAVPSHEERIVERWALHQILAILPERRVAALIALAAFDTMEQAATAMGLSYRAFVILVNRARADFRALWHEGEAPSAMWVSAQSEAARKRRYRARLSERRAWTDNESGT